MKILTLNTWQERGPWQIRWQVILEGLERFQPDIVGFQEGFNLRWAQEIKKKAKFPYLVFHPEPSGLMLLSRFSVKQSACLTMQTKSPTEDYLRYALFAELEIEKKRIAVFNTHLSWQADEGAFREKQADELLKFVEAKAAGRDVLVMGDFNATPQAAEVRKMTGRGGFTDTFAELHPADPGWTWNNVNPFARDAHHPMPDRRIDYIFVRPVTGFLKDIESVRLVWDLPNHSGIWASDHFGVLTEFKEVL